MKPLIKIILIIASIFASTFILFRATGLLTVAQIETWLTQAQAISPIYIFSIVTLLLFADLFIAVPTLTITILAGHFLGFGWGSMAALSGLILAGLAGYTISRYYGEAVLRFLLRDKDKQKEVRQTFSQHGFVMILLARAAPILPETTTCLSGLTKMKFAKFLLAYLLSTVPYVLIAAYGGSKSTLANPKPAIFTAIGLYAILWTSWFLYRRFKKIN